MLKSNKIREHYGIQRVEVIFQTIDKINRDQELLKDIKLGVEIRDSCWYAPIALQQTIELIRDSIIPHQSKSTLSQHHSQCSNNFENEIHPNDDATLIGIVGPASSSIALQVQNLLQLFSIPQVGYSTTSKDLSDKARFSTFMRVVPSDYYQAQVMVDIVKINNWTYIHTVHTDENYGQSGIQAFRELADKNNICIAKEDSFQELIRNLEEDEKAHVIVCFCEGLTVRKLLMAIKYLNLTNNFIIIGSDGWADRQDVVTDYEAQAVGSISIRIHSPYLHSFDDEYLKLDPFNNSRNPWFREFWEDKFHCKMPLNRIVTTTTTELPITLNDNDTEIDPEYLMALPVTAQKTPYCTGHENLSRNHKQEPKLSFLVKALYTYAYALQAYKDDVCGRDYVGACQNLKKSFNHSLFFNYLMNVSFTTNEKDLIEFNQEGDVTARYDIMNFQLNKDGTYDYVQIGDWINHTLNLFKPLQSPPNVVFVKSVCSDPCPKGYYKIQDTPEQQNCCFNCAPCDDNQYLKNETHCENCKEGWWPNADQTECIENPIEYLEWTDTESIISISFSIFGTILSAIVLIIFIHYNNTPVVKASTRELCYIVLCGMIMSHLSIFSILAHPTTKICALSRTLPGISFSMIYGSLLIKTNRISRLLAISKKRFPTKKLKFMSPLSQIVLAFLLVTIESIIAIGMLIIEQPEIEFQYPRHLQTILVCKESPLTILAPLTFIFILILLNVFFAIKTRNVPENFNETKFVGFAIYTTCIIWLAFFPIYYGSEMQIITKCLCTSLSSIMTLAFMFFPKIYIILFHPEKNVRALFTTSKSIRCHIGATRHSNISQKTSNSISSVHVPSSTDVESSGIHQQRSFKKSSYCQTSIEKLSIQKVDTSSSPIKDEMFDYFYPDQRITFYRSEPVDHNGYRVDERRYYDYRKVPTSPSHVKLKRNKIYVKDVNSNGNVHTMKQKSKHKIKSRKGNVSIYDNHQKPIYCVECMELEKQNQQLIRQNHVNENEHLMTTKMSMKSQIFTVEKLPLDSNLRNEKKKIAISEESLSECSISDTACKLKRITIQLN
ncbi:hypothetical protein ACKWTF_006714 [Chironomus riparius]